MPHCAIKWCGKCSKTSSLQKDNTTFHRFPRCPERKKQWMDATSRGDDWFPSNNSVICSRHFTEDNFHYMKNRRRLMDSAVPSLYLPCLERVPYTMGMDTSAGCSVENTEIPVAGTSFEQSVTASRPTDTSTASIADSQLILVTPEKQKRKITPSAYETPAEKRLCRRILELKNAMKAKNIQMKKLSDSNRRLTKKVVSLKALLTELDLLTAENNETLNSLCVKCSEIIRRQRRQIQEGKSGLAPS